MIRVHTVSAPTDEKREELFGEELSQNLEKFHGEKLSIYVQKPQSRIFYYRRCSRNVGLKTDFEPWTTP